MWLSNWAELGETSRQILHMKVTRSAADGRTVTDVFAVVFVAFVAVVAVALADAVAGFGNTIGRVGSVIADDENVDSSAVEEILGE